MLNRLIELNPEISVYHIEDLNFKEYGRVIKGFDTKEFLEASNKIDFPENGSLYTPSCAKFEQLGFAEEIKNNFFGTLPIQIGYCRGHSNYLNATEWHFSSEINIAVTPLVIIVAKRQEMVDNRLDSACMKAFYVLAGTMLETYATTLHFCPCEVQSEGFGWIVALPLGTNTPLDTPCSDKYLTKKNKWQIAHYNNASLVESGVKAGIYGENYKIKY